MKLVGVVADALDWRVIIQAEALGHWSTRADLSPVPSRVASSLPVPVQEPESAFLKFGAEHGCARSGQIFYKLAGPSPCLRFSLREDVPCEGTP